jgi:hypothetical protein
MYSNIYSKLISKYQNKYSKNNTNTNNINKKKYKVKIIRRNIPVDADLSGVLSKRTFDKAFKQETFDDFRYGQHIDIKFFEKNIGHIVI